MHYQDNHAGDLSSSSLPHSCSHDSAKCCAVAGHLIIIQTACWMLCGVLQAEPSGQELRKNRQAANGSRSILLKATLPGIRNHQAMAQIQSSNPPARAGPASGLPVQAPGVSINGISLGTRNHPITSSISCNPPVRPMLYSKLPDQALGTDTKRMMPACPQQTTAAPGPFHRSLRHSTMSALVTLLGLRRVRQGREPEVQGLPQSMAVGMTLTSGTTLAIPVLVMLTAFRKSLSRSSRPLRGIQIRDSLLGLLPSSGLESGDSSAAFESTSTNHHSDRLCWALFVLLNVASRCWWQQQDLISNRSLHHAPSHDALQRGAAFLYGLKALQIDLFLALCVSTVGWSSSLQKQQKPLAASHFLLPSAWSQLRPEHGQEGLSSRS